MTANPEPRKDYSALDPHCVLDAVESLGLPTSGHILALNSYENRVYRIGLEDRAPVIAKFYRPRRWSDAAILEEHTFAHELAEAEIPVVAPLRDAAGKTLYWHQGYRYALFPLQAGRWPELDDPDDLLRIGRFIGRLHLIGGGARFRHRASIDIERMGDASVRYLLDQGFLPEDLRPAYASLAADLLERVRQRFADAGETRVIRLHGDCHRGNILWHDGRPHFVDLDDCQNGPPVQDLWMMLSGERDERNAQLIELIEGYREFADFDPRELHLIEALRALRMLHYAAWLARRWDDPAFPQAFPWFATQAYWERHVLELREQLYMIDQPPLRITP